MPKTKNKKKKNKKRKYKSLSRVTYRTGSHSMTIQRGGKSNDITGLTCETHYKKGVITELLDRVEGDVFRIVARSCSASVPMSDVLKRSREFPTKTLITLKLGN